MQVIAFVDAMLCSKKKKKNQDIHAIMIVGVVVGVVVRI
jgi:hypothetical protein